MNQLQTQLSLAEIAEKYIRCSYDQFFKGREPLGQKPCGDFIRAILQEQGVTVEGRLRDFGKLVLEMPVMSHGILPKGFPFGTIAESGTYFAGNILFGYKNNEAYLENEPHHVMLVVDEKRLVRMSTSEDRVAGTEKTYYGEVSPVPFFGDFPLGVRIRKVELP